MARIRTIAVGAALVMFVYFGATATDTHVGVVTAAIQAALESEMEVEWIGEWFVGVGGSDLAAVPALIGILLLLFGGLPVAIFGLLLERHWAGVPIERRRYGQVPYAVLMFQIASTLLSGFLIVTLGPTFISALNEGPVYARDWFLPVYWIVQALAGLVAIPVWRRLLCSASDVQARFLLLTRAKRV